MAKNNLQRKANQTFYQILGIGLVFLTVVLFLSANLYSKLSLVSKSFMGKVESICGCASYLSFADHPFIFVGLIFLGLAVVGFFIFTVFKIIRFKNSTAKFIKANLKNKKQSLSSRLKREVQSIGLKGQVVEINSSRAIVFCFGMLKPKICISSGLIKKLSVKELRAVLMHEHSHLIVHEPLKLFIVKIMAKVLFFIPGLKLLTTQYLTLSELAADQRATYDFQDKVPLAKALYKAIKSSENLNIKNNLALSFFSMITEERVNKLADDKYVPKFKFFTAKLSFGVLLILLSPVLFNMLFSAGFSSNNIGHNTTACPMTQTASSHECQSKILPDCIPSYNSKIHPC